eukprot:6171917-Pleurochrysis_carterae.AAC.3
MLEPDRDGQPVYRRKRTHSCAHCCKPVYTACVCDYTVTKRSDLCCKEHLLAYNAAYEAGDCRQLPVRRIDPELLASEEENRRAIEGEAGSDVNLTQDRSARTKIDSGSLGSAEPQPQPSDCYLSKITLKFANNFNDLTLTSHLAEWS